MSEESKSVLTAEAWAEELGGDPRQRLEWACSEVGASDALSIPALAGLALQFSSPDGGPLFTWEDVGVLESAVESTAGERGGDFTREYETLNRLRSLLPPRKEPV